MSPLLFVYSALPILSTFLGGYVVYRWKKDLHPWLSLSGGILLGVAFLDLLPDALERGDANGVGHPYILMGALGAILLFHFLDKGLAFHAHHEHVHGEPLEHCENDRHERTQTWIRALGLTFHSLLDGIAIGGSFAVDPNLGLLVMLAVVTHDFSDGMSTVTILKHGLGSGHKAILPFLALDAIAPFVGSFIGVALAPSAGVIAILLAVFAGFFIFLSLSELLPQAHEGKTPHRFGLLLTLLGIGLVIFIRSFAEI
jgi:zinc transporter, ZIP family